MQSIQICVAEHRTSGFQFVALLALKILKYVEAKQVQGKNMLLTTNTARNKDNETGNYETTLPCPSNLMYHFRYSPAVKAHVSMQNIPEENRKYPPSSTIDEGRKGGRKGGREGERGKVYPGVVPSLHQRSF